MLVAALMIIVGTTYAGGDWHTGSISNQLLFEPRRTRVWVTKALVALVGCGLVAAVLLAAFWAALALVADARGIATGPGTVSVIAWESLRGVALAAAGGLGGYALTMLLRHTVGTLALLFAYAAGGEALLALLPVDGSARFSPTYNLFAWVRDGVRVYDQSVVCSPSQGPTCDQRLSITTGRRCDVPRGAAARHAGPVGGAVPPPRRALSPPPGGPPAIGVAGGRGVE